jgi:hypothetical protein
LEKEEAMTSVIDLGIFSLETSFQKIKVYYYSGRRKEKEIIIK